MPKRFDTVVHEIVRRHLSAANSLCARPDAVNLTPVEADAIANMITDEISAEYQARISEVTKRKRKK
jgi:hypothetical protein